MTYEIIKNSESKTGYNIPDVEYRGLVNGLLCGWQFEFKNSNGDIRYNSVAYHWGTPEDYCNSWLCYGEDALFEMERMNGYVPTGLVIFRGYAEEYYDLEEREECVRMVEFPTSGDGWRLLEEVA